MKERTLISEFVKKRRAIENLTTQEFADKYGISKSNVSRYETGFFDNPSVLTASRFCSTFNVGLDEFVVDFFYTDESIEKTFTFGKHFAERFGSELIDTPGKKVITRFYNRFKEEAGLSNLENIDAKEDERNRQGRIYIPHYARCRNRNNEEVWIYRFLNSFEGKAKRPLNYLYGYLDKIICNVAAYTEEELGCNNFVFIIPNKKMITYLTESRFKSNSSNVMLVYSRDNKSFEEPVLLFGKNFLKQK